MANKMIKIKYCGNCNPDVNPKEVKKTLEALVAEIPRNDLSVMVDGCSRACLTKRKQADKSAGNVIFVSSKEVVRRKQ